jgi:hypothetical protein
MEETAYMGRLNPNLAAKVADYLDHVYIPHTRESGSPCCGSCGRDDPGLPPRPRQNSRSGDSSGRGYQKRDSN